MKLTWSALAMAPLLTPVAAHDGDHGPTAGSIGMEARARITYLEALAHERPDDVAVVSRLAQAKLGMARRLGTHDAFHSAEIEFRKWRDLSPGQPASHVGLGYTLLGQHEFEGALRSARQSARIAPLDAPTWALLGDVHFALGNVVEAEFAYRRLDQHGITMQSLARMALVHQELGRVTEARAAFEEAIQAAQLLGESSIDIAWCHTLLAELDLDEGAWDAAHQRYLTALELDPAGHQAALGLARCEIAKGDVVSAHRRLVSLADHHPGPRTWIALGEALELMGSTFEATTWFERAAAPVRVEVARGELGHLRDLAEAELRLGHLEAAHAAALRDLTEVRQDSGAFEILARIERAMEAD